MKKLSLLWKNFLNKGFAILTILMMLGQIGQGGCNCLCQPASSWR